MAKVIATHRGYYGRILREAGDVFEAEGKASWFEPVKAGKAQVDPKDPAPENDPGKVDLQAMSVKDLRAMAKDLGIGLGAGVTTKAEIIAAIEAGPVDQGSPAEPFSDAPAPVRVENEANDATGATQPDWVAGGQADI